MIALSIIIPMYNAESYIEDTLQSILCQVNERIEIIIVDDGSSDECFKLVESKFSYEIERGDLVLLTQSNSGVSVARNVGIELANGYYIGFVDADDLVLVDYIETILNIIDNESVDIIEFGCKKFIEKEDILTSKSIYPHQEFGMNNTVSIINDVFLTSIFYPPLRVTKAELLRSYRFPVGVRFCEDVIFFHQVYLGSKTVFNVEKSLYAYRENPAGATMNVKQEYVDRMIEFYLYLMLSKGEANDYLKVNIFYVIYKCTEVLRKKLVLERGIKLDAFILGVRMCLNKRVPFRKKIILLCPNVFQWAVFAVRRLRS